MTIRQINVAALSRPAMPEPGPCDVALRADLTGTGAVSRPWSPGRQSVPVGADPQ